MNEFRAAAGMGKSVRGRALVAKDGFSARYDLDRINGVFRRPEHKLAGARRKAMTLRVARIAASRLQGVIDPEGGFELLPRV